MGNIYLIKPGMYLAQIIIIHCEMILSCNKNVGI